MSEEDAKVVNMFKSNVELSPLLADDEVEVKDYTENLGGVVNTQENTNSEKNETVKPEKQEVKAETEKEPEKQNKEPEKGFFQQNGNNYEAPEMPEIPEDDGIEQMEIDENGGFAAEAAGEMLSDNDVKAKAKMILQSYNAIVPPLLKKPIEADVDKVHYILSYNNVEKSAIKEIEKFLNNSNKEIFNTLKLNNDEMAILAPPLAAVIQKYNLSSDNPVVNLLTAVVGVAVSKYASIQSILDRQTTHLQMIINGYNLRMPQGLENYDIAKGKMKNAA